MNKSDIQILFDFNGWRNARILSAASRISNDLFIANGGFPHGGLRGTLVHQFSAEWIWYMRWLGTPPAHWLKPDDFPDLATLKSHWFKHDSILQGFISGLTEDKLKSQFDYVSTKGVHNRRILWQSMAHVVNHGTQHSTEAAAILTRLGQSPGDIDLIVYFNDALPR